MLRLLIWLLPVRLRELPGLSIVQFCHQAHFALSTRARVEVDFTLEAFLLRRAAGMWQGEASQLVSECTGPECTG